MRIPLLSAVLLICTVFELAEGAESRCYGTAENGRLENGWKLPREGKNFSTYSTIGTLAGRTYVHSSVYKVIVDAYAELARRAPEKVYVYGETSFEDGGNFWPHKTHQNGLSVDFFVPVVDRAGTSVKLPTWVGNKLGYDIEFSGRGHYNDLTIDYEAMALHLWAIKTAADRHGVKVRRVIFDNSLQSELFKAKAAKGLQRALTFSTRKPWVRHDEHYHIDFSVPCSTL